MRQAQAAVEFLTTYGWMLLAVAAVFGAMAYFGIGNVRDTIPLRCDFGFDFGCGATYAADDGTYIVQLKNTQSKGFYLNRTICSFPNSNERVLTVYDDVFVPVSSDIVLECDPSPLSEELALLDKQLYTMKVIYEYNESGALPNIATGEMVIQVIEGPIPAAYTNQIVSGTTSLFS